MLFLIEYDRSRGRIETFKVFADDCQNTAQEARLDLELRLNRVGIEREVVLLQAASEDALRVTHRRYFEDAAALASIPPTNDVQHREQ